MERLAYLPWMKRADWRDDPRPCLVVDLAVWPPDEALAPLPPVPVLAVGPSEHPQAGAADVLVADFAMLTPIVGQIVEAPGASAILVALLRAIDGLPPAHALILESLAYAASQAGQEHASWLASRPVRPPATQGSLRVARHGGALAMVLDRPGALNAIDRTLRDQLFDAFTLAALDIGIDRIRLSGRGRCFSIGADLVEFGTTRDPVAAHGIRARTLPALALLRRPEIFEAHVHGACIGAGLELAAFARRLTATPDAWFQLPEISMGIIPGFGGCVSIPGRIGRQRAAALMLSGRRFGARRALALGLIDAIVGDSGDDHLSQLGGS